MSFRTFSKVVFIFNFAAIAIWFFILFLFLFLFFWRDEQLFSVNAKLSVGNPQAVSENRLSHGYLYINLPPVFMCLLPVVLSYL